MTEISAIMYRFRPIAMILQQYMYPYEGCGNVFAQFKYLKDI